jgi:hypothetical protein
MNRFRRWLANILVRLARRIYPESDEILSFWADRMVELAMTGQSIIKVSAVEPEKFAAGVPISKEKP